MSKVALITGITGQTGSFLADLLLEKGYEVHGIIRRCASFNTDRIDHVFDQLNLHYGDLADSSSIRKIMFKVEPDEIYHMGAQSHVRVSFDIPEYTADVTGVGTLRVLEAIKDYVETFPMRKRPRFYFAGSSEMFGNQPAPQSESTPFEAASPYSAAKVFGCHITRNYRESYGMHASCGILFNHESERRGETFVTRKITRAATRIKVGLQEKLELGNLEAKRDWGYAKDYAEAIWMMVQQDEPDDYVISTGESYSVKEWLQIVFDNLGLDWKEYVEINPKYYRPTDVNHLQGDCTKAKEKLGWKPRTDIFKLADIMINHDLELAQKEKIIKDHS